MRKTDLLEYADRKVVVLDGGMGTGIQGFELTPDDFDGHEGCNELLVETRPDVIEQIHAGYFAVGCDAVETNTFGANGVVLAEYGLEARTEELNRKAAALARKVADRFETEEAPKFVIGSVGPGTKLPSLGHATFDELREAFLPQMLGLVSGGADAICIETCQDLLQVKAAIDAAREAFRKTGVELPLQVSVTIESTGTMLLGSDVQAAISTLKPLCIDVLGLNCATGPAEMKRHVEHLSLHGPARLMAMPNAGLPVNVDGEIVYTLTPDEFADWVEGFVRENGVGIVGGCCGTTPEHLAALVKRVENLAAPTRTNPKPETRNPNRPENGVSSLYQAVSLRQTPPPLIIGERTNANGSKVFRKHLLADDFDGMLAVAREQEKGGAHVLDVSVAYVGRDEKADVERFIPMLARNIRLPLVLDSTDPDVLTTGLKKHGGRCVINSINLEDGRERLDQVATLAARFGAAVIALTIDEDGMAMTADRKLEVAERIFDICTNEHGLAPSDLIFDMLTFTVASGDESTRNAAVETLDAISRFKAAHPECHTVLGVSNVSFGLRPPARRVLNSVFLQQAVEAGLDQAIVNAKGIVSTHSIDDGVKNAALKLLNNDRSGGDPLHAYMALFADAKTAAAAGPAADDQPPAGRLHDMVVDGVGKGVEEVLDLVLGEGKKPVDIINQILIVAMKRVGELFGAGEMQLPFVLQAAEVMKRSVTHLEQFMDQADVADRGVLVLATVRGDVHDIGKNLVDIIVSNNGFSVVNLGIKVPVEEMIRAAEEHNATAIGMSGLLVKSTVFMKENLEEIKRRGLDVPVLLGGAALTRKFVEEDLRKVYGPDVHYCADAFAGLHEMNRIEEGANPSPARAGVAGAEAKEAGKKSAPAPDAPLPDIDYSMEVPRPPFLGVRPIFKVPRSEIFSNLNELTLFRGQWRYRRGKMSREEYDAFVEREVRPLLDDMKADSIRQGFIRPEAIYGYFNAFSRGNDVVILDEGQNELATLSFPRRSSAPRYCIADFIRPEGSGEPDVLGMFVVTIGKFAQRRTADLYALNRYKDYLHFHGLAVETAETVAEWLHTRMRGELGIHHDDQQGDQAVARQGYRGSRYSFGYPACPDLEQQKILFKLLDPLQIGVKLTEGCQMNPEYSVSAIVVHHPQARYFNLG